MIRWVYLADFQVAKESCLQRLWIGGVIELNVMEFHNGSTLFVKGMYYLDDVAYLNADVLN